MILQLFLLFFAGIIIDLLVTYYTKAVAQKKVLSATFLSGIVTFVNFLLLTIIIKESSMNGMFNIMAYAGGNTVGTFFAMIKDTF
jgi:uncharacterized membrane protein YjjP (DUF1212 family)